MAYMQPSEHPDKNKPKKDTPPPLTNKPSFTETVKKGYDSGSTGSMVGKYSRGGQNTDILGGIMGAGRAALNYFKD
tara:strand:- start:30 stop:257 length:228 start_codon:yes stop_codon:yes gene_type:complete